MSKRRKIKLLIGLILIVLNFELLFNRASISSLAMNIIFAGMFTIVFYLIYDDKLEDFEERIKRLKRNLEPKIDYDSVHDRYTYFLLGEEYKRNLFLEVIKLSCDISTRKAEKILKHFEKESRGLKK